MQSEQELWLCAHATLQAQLQQSQASLQILAAENESLKQSLKQSQAVKASESTNLNGPSLPPEWTGQKQAFLQSECAKNTNDVSKEVATYDLTCRKQVVQKLAAPAGQVNQQNTSFLSPRIPTRLAPLQGRNTVSSPQRAMFHPKHGCLQSGATRGHSYSPSPTCQLSNLAFDLKQTSSTHAHAARSPPTPPLALARTPPSQKTLMATGGKIHLDKVKAKLKACDLWSWAKFTKASASVFSERGICLNHLYSR